MHSDGSVNEGIAIDEFNRSVSGANIAGNIDNACDAAFEKLRNQRMPVLVKGFIRKVGMCVEKFHKINTPLDNKVKTGSNIIIQCRTDRVINTSCIFMRRVKAITLPGGRSYLLFHYRNL